MDKVVLHLGGTRVPRRGRHGVHPRSIQPAGPIGEILERKDEDLSEDDLVPTAAQRGGLAG